jgi:hypothetical protein
MLRIAYEASKLFRLPALRKLKEAGPRQGFFEREQFAAVRRHLQPADLQLAVTIAYTYGWRMQSEVLTLERRQLDLKAATLRLEPGTTKNDEGRIRLPHARADCPPGGPARARASAGATPRAHRAIRVPSSGQGSACRTAAARFPQSMGEGLQGRRSTGTATPRLPPHRSPQHGQCRGAGARRHEGDGPQDAGLFDRYHIVSPGDLQDVARKLSGTFAGTSGAEGVDGRPATL